MLEKMTVSWMKQEPWKYKETLEKGINWKRKGAEHQGVGVRGPLAGLVAGTQV